MDIEKIVLGHLHAGNVKMQPCPHIDVQNMFPEAIHQQMLRELPSYESIFSRFQINENIPSAFLIKKPDLESKFSVPIIGQFLDVLASEKFVDKVFKLFEKEIAHAMPYFARGSVRPAEPGLFVNFPKTTVSGVGNSGKTFIRGPHLDDPRDVFVTLFYLKPEDSQVSGGELELWRYKDGFKGFRRDIWWDERELPLSTVTKEKSVPYESNRFVLLLDGIDAIHGVSPVELKGSCRFRISGGAWSSVPNYEYTEYLSVPRKILEPVKLAAQKVQRKIRKYLRVKP